jgi:hypothetical protein
VAGSPFDSSSQRAGLEAVQVPPLLLLGEVAEEDVVGLAVRAPHRHPGPPGLLVERVEELAAVAGVDRLREPRVRLLGRLRPLATAGGERQRGHGQQP